MPLLQHIQTHNNSYESIGRVRLDTPLTSLLGGSKRVLVRQTNAVVWRGSAKYFQWETFLLDL
jgi:hypothetical protein